MYTDVMLDLETWGLAPNSAIRSIGARFFNLDQIVHENAIYSQAPAHISVNGPITSSFQNNKAFYCNVDRASCERYNLLIDKDTEAWWSQQSPDIEAALQRDQRTVPDAVCMLVAWLRLNGNPDIRAWSNGAAFDIVLLEWCMRICAIEPPWKYYNVRDTRTLKHAALAADKLDAEWPKQFRKHAHHALFDAEFQAFETQHHWNIVNRGWLGRLLAACRF